MVSEFRLRSSARREGLADSTARLAKAARFSGRQASQVSRLGFPVPQPSSPRHGSRVSTPSRCTKCPAGFIHKRAALSAQEGHWPGTRSGRQHFCQGSHKAAAPPTPQGLLWSIFQEDRVPESRRSVLGKGTLGTRWGPPSQAVDRLPLGPCQTRAQEQDPRGTPFLLPLVQPALRDTMERARQTEAPPVLVAGSVPTLQTRGLRQNRAPNCSAAAHPPVSCLLHRHADS